MGFVGEVMKGVSGIQYYYIVGLFIFLILFVVVVYRTIKIPRKKLEQYKNSIFESDREEPTAKNK